MAADRGAGGDWVRHQLVALVTSLVEEHGRDAVLEAMGMEQVLVIGDLSEDYYWQEATR